MLGSGFSGGVWLANDQKTGGLVVVKFFSKRDSVHDEYFMHLLRLHAILSSRSLHNVVSPIEVGQYGELGYQILPYLSEYTSLSNTLSANGRRDPHWVLSLLARIATAIDELHALGIIHADLKPSNILITSSPTPEVRIIDFGMVRKVDFGNTVELVSTWRYLHPTFTGEDDNSTDDKQSKRIQIGGSGPPGSYVDVYALGVIALEMLTGQANYDRPPGERSIQQTICDKNPLFAEEPVGVRDGV